MTSSEVSIKGNVGNGRGETFFSSTYNTDLSDSWVFNKPPDPPPASGAEKVDPELALYTELWHACAGPLVTVPNKGEHVFYFPQGHIEQDMSRQPPTQELVARDLHKNEWHFRHIFRGQPRRHLVGACLLARRDSWLEMPSYF